MTTKYLTLTTILTLAALFIITPSSTPPAHAAPYSFYLSTTGTDAGDCTSNAAPCATFSYTAGQISAIAGPGDSAALIVEPGTYFTNGYDWYIDFDLGIYGSSPATTFFDGNNTQRALDISFSGANSLEIYAITLQNGTTPYPESGGGLRLTGSGANPITIEDVHIRNNTGTGGAGISLTGVDINLTDVIITNNQTTDGFGGGIEAFDSDLSINYTQISHNLAYRPGNSTNGGGLSLTNSSLSLTNSWVHHNTVESVSGTGGGLYMGGTTTTLAISNTIFSNNQIIASEVDGIAYGAGIHCQANLSSPPANILNTTISHNSVQDINGLDAVAGVAFSTSSFCPVFLQHTTVAFNRLETLGPAPTYTAAALTLFGTKTIFNSIVGGTTNANNCSFGDTTTGVINLSDDNTCTGYTQTANLGIAPLSSVFGWWYPMNPLLLGSPALNYSNSNCLTLDGRGATRSFPCDIGAFEGFYYPAYLPVLRR